MLPVTVGVFGPQQPLLQLLSPLHVAWPQSLACMRTPIRSIGCIGNKGWTGNSNHLSVQQNPDGVGGVIDIMFYMVCLVESDAMHLSWTCKVCLTSSLKSPMILTMLLEAQAADKLEPCQSVADTCFLPSADDMHDGEIKGSAAIRSLTIMCMGGLLLARPTSSLSSEALRICGWGIAVCAVSSRSATMSSELWKWQQIPTRQWQHVSNHSSNMTSQVPRTHCGLSL